MNRYRRAFPKRHTFLAVVHAETQEQALRNIKIAREGGADGVFLINHSITFVTLLDIYKAATETFPGFWIGLNCLELGAEAVDIVPSTVDGIWADNAGVTMNTKDMAQVIFNSVEKRERASWDGIYFGGVAFKGRAHVDDLEAATLLATPFVDVITTSGAGTGIPADVEKIRRMKVAAGAHPLAIASGITPGNVRMYMPYADCFLVATGVSDSHTELNPERVRALANVLHG